MTPHINRMILEKAKIYPRYVEYGRSIADYQILRDIISRSQSAIQGPKSTFFVFVLGESLNDQAILPKILVNLTQISP